MAVWVQRPSLQWGPGLSGATARKALLSETRVASPPEAGPQGPMRLAGAQLPWYLALLASDLAALSESSLSLTAPLFGQGKFRYAVSALSAKLRDNNNDTKLTTAPK